MLFTPDDFPSMRFDPTSEFQSVLPGHSLLKDTTLDPGLSTEMPGIRGAQLQKYLVKQAAIDALHLQQFTFYDVATNTGILSTFEDVMRDSMGIVQIAGTLGTVELTEQLILTGIGTAAKALSSIPNLYTQIAGAVIGFGLMIYNLI